MDNYISDNEYLASEIELLDSMFASESYFKLDSESGERKNSCLRIVSKSPRFIFHVELRGRGK